MMIDDTETQTHTQTHLDAIVRTLQQHQQASYLDKGGNRKLEYVRCGATCATREKKANVLIKTNK